MSEITDSTIEQVAAMARLHVDQSEMSQYRDNFSRIINYLSNIASAQDRLTKVVQGDELQVTPERDDTMIVSGLMESALEQAPRRSGSTYLLPRIVE